MLKLDNNLLDELGMGSLPEDQKRAMLQHIYDTLELRVGTNLANQMTDQQLEEFEKFIDDGGDANQAQALQWLETNLPNYKQVVNEVFETLKAEIKQMAPQIVAASAPAGQQPVSAPAPVQSSVTPAAQPMTPQTQQSMAPPTVYQPQMPGQPQPTQMPPAPQPQFAQPPQMPAYQPPAVPAPQQPWADPQAIPQQPLQNDDAGQQPYQFPAQQPPAGPGGQQQQPPQYPGGQQAA